MHASFDQMVLILQLTCSTFVSTVVNANTHLHGNSARNNNNEEKKQQQQKRQDKCEENPDSNGLCPGYHRLRLYELYMLLEAAAEAGAREAWI